MRHNGIPVCGSSDICLNRTLPIAAIVYLQQGTENHIQLMRFAERVKSLISETTISFFDQEFVEQALEVLQRLGVQVLVLLLFVHEGRRCCNKII